MADKVNVRSIEAVERFRRAFQQYLQKANLTLDEINQDVLRTQSWLEHDQRIYWEHQVKKRAKALDQTRQDLMKARFSVFQDSSGREQMMVKKAERALHEAEAKLKVIKQWKLLFESRVKPLEKQLEKLRNLLLGDMSKATTFLTRSIDALEAYAATDA